MHAYDDDDREFGVDPAGDQPLTPDEYREISDEIAEQPEWRETADREMDYADGNQLDGDLLAEMRELGYPPAIENVIGPTLESIRGYQAVSRTDWRVTASGEPGGEDVAIALNYKLNQAESKSRADRALSEAFRGQIGCGIGWVEVSRESDPFRFPYRCRPVRRQEIHWDMRTVNGETDIADSRWLRRQRWLTPERIAQTFPEHADLLGEIRRHGPGWWNDVDERFLDGGSSTGLRNAWGEARSRTISEDRWYNPVSKELCLVELWYRRWVRVYVLETPDGRVVEYDENSLSHNIAIGTGRVSPRMATVTRVRRAFWLGPHCLHDGPSPYTHRHFPYVPLFGFIEDNTGVPYGYIRGMKYAQDSLNSGLSKLRWGMSVVRTERTKDAVLMTDEQLRRQVARPNADIVLNAEHFRNNPGARFEVKRDYQLTDQHYNLLTDSRATIERVTPVTPGFRGSRGSATSGLQEQTQVEQSTQALGWMMDNFNEARTQVGELLLAMIIEDIGEKETQVAVEGDAITPDRFITLNQAERDPATGMTYLSNDLLRTRLMVSLEDVPSTSSYRAQQLAAMTEAVKPLPGEYLAAAVPFLASLMDVPFKRDMVEAFRAVGQQPSPEEIDQQIEQAKQQALVDAGNEIKLRELELKERKADSEIRGLDAKAVMVGVQAAFSAMQAGAQVAQMPMIAPIADEVMKGAGYRRPTPAGHDPNFPVPGETAAMDIRSPYVQGAGAEPGSEQLPDLAEVNQNTSPTFPPVPDDGASPMQGIETPRTSDNLPEV